MYPVSFSIFSLEICIFRLSICIFRLSICIFRLKICISSLRINFLLGDNMFRNGMVAFTDVYPYGMFIVSLRRVRQVRVVSCAMSSIPFCIFFVNQTMHFDSSIYNFGAERLKKKRFEQLTFINKGYFNLFSFT